jgi:hypothetical protein
MAWTGFDIAISGVSFRGEFTLFEIGHTRMRSEG